MARRSTLADKPELDSRLQALLVKHKGEVFLPLNNDTMHYLSWYLNGRKPLAHTCRFDRLMITGEANKVPAGTFVTALEHIGHYCEHLVIVAPFYTTEVVNVFDRECDNFGSGNDWEKILECFDNLQTLTFVHPQDEPTNLMRDTFYALNYALKTNTTLQKIKKVHLDVPPQVMFDYHYDYHHSTDNIPGYKSPQSMSVNSTPLTLVGSDMIYADNTPDDLHIAE